MPYSDYVNGLIKSQSTISSGSNIPKTTAITTITSPAQFTATLLLNTAVIVFEGFPTLRLPTLLFPSKESIATALSANSYNATNGIILDFVLVNKVGQSIILDYNNLQDPIDLGTTILAANQANSYKIISSQNGGTTSFIIYLISGAGGYSSNIKTTETITSVGIEALLNTTTGNNTAIGYVALGGNSTNCNDNTAVGNEALLNIGNYCNCNTAVGSSITDAGFDNTILGYNASAATFNNCVVLGEGATATMDGQFVVGSTGALNVGTVDTIENTGFTPGPVTRVRINGSDYYITLGVVSP